MDDLDTTRQRLRSDRPAMPDGGAGFCLVRTDSVNEYRTIVADPPWLPKLHANNPRRSTIDKGGPQKHYKTMTVRQICALKIPAAPQAHLYLWVVNQHVDWGYTVARAWGFEPEQMLTWCKPGLGVGRFQCNTESFLLCRKGSRFGNAFGRGGRNVSATGGTWFQWPRGRHSEKPTQFYHLVETLSEPDYLELFARTPRLGWERWGNEVYSTVEIVAD